MGKDKCNTKLLNKGQDFSVFSLCLLSPNMYCIVFSCIVHSCLKAFREKQGKKIMEKLAIRQCFCSYRYR